MRAAILSLLLAAAPVSAETVWKHPYPSVKVLKKTLSTPSGLKIVFHAAIIDLSRPEVQVIVSPPKYRGERTSRFAKAIGAQVAINGGFWELLSKKPMGWVISAGRPWKDLALSDRLGFLAFTKENKAWIQPPGSYPKPSPSDGYMVISGMPLIVDKGAPGKVRGCGYICMEHPRSAAGISQDGWTLILAVSEGRIEGIKSTKPRAMAEFLIDLGAYQALQLDGGGSSSLYVESLGGMLNAPAEGKERSVINHIGVIISDPPTPSTPPPPPLHLTEDDYIPVRNVENPPRMGLLIAGGIAAVILAGVALGLVIRRRSKRPR